MAKKLHYYWLSLIFAFHSSLLTATEPFTAEQLEFIQTLLATERVKIRQEILAELKGKDDAKDKLEISEQEKVAKQNAASKKTDDDKLKKLTAAEIQNLSNRVKYKMREYDMALWRGDLFGEFDKKQLPASEKQVKEHKTSFELNTFKETSKVGLKYERRYSDSSGGANAKAYYSKFGLVASVPLDKNNNEFTNIATLDGLTNAFDLSFNYSRFYVYGNRKRYLTPDGGYDPLFVDVCKAVGIDVLKHETCEGKEVKDTFKDRGASKLYPYYKLFFWAPRTWKWFYGVNARIGHEEFGYIDATTLMKQDQDETPWTVGANFGFIPPKLNALINVNFEYQNAFKASKSGILCPVPTGATPTACINDNIGPPTDNDKKLLSLEMRSELAAFAYVIKLTHDFDKNDTGVDLPIYLFRNEKEVLNGGIRLGWTNTDSLTFGLFAGSKFKLFK